MWPLTEGVGVTVGVLDTGVQASAPDLRAVVLRGADTVGDSGDGDKDFDSAQDGHGTGVAAMIVGQGLGGPMGIAPESKILPVHVNNPGGGPESVSAGIKYAVRHGAGVITISVEAEQAPSPTSCYPNIQDAVAYALAHNIVIVSASGDINLGGNSLGAPGACPGVLTVGGVKPVPNDGYGIPAALGIPAAWLPPAAIPERVHPVSRPVPARRSVPSRPVGT